MKRAAALLSFGYLLFLLGPFWRCRGSGTSIAICVPFRVVHLGITVGAAALVIRVEFFTHFRLRISLEILVNALIVFISTAAVGNAAVVAGGEILVLERSRENCSGLRGV